MVEKFVLGKESCLSCLLPLFPVENDVRRCFAWAPDGRHIGETRSPILVSDNENPHFTDQTSPSGQVNWNSQLRRRISTQEMRTEEGGQICDPGARNCRLICLPITRGSEHGLLLVPRKTRRTRPALTPARAPSSSCGICTALPSLILSQFPGIDRCFPCAGESLRNCSGIDLQCVG